MTIENAFYTQTNQSISFYHFQKNYYSLCWAPPCLSTVSESDTDTCQTPDTRYVFHQKCRCYKLTIIFVQIANRKGNEREKRSYQNLQTREQRARSNMLRKTKMIERMSPSRESIVDGVLQRRLFLWSVEAVAGVGCIFSGTAVKLCCGGERQLYEVFSALSTILRQRMASTRIVRLGNLISFNKEKLHHLLNSIETAQTSPLVLKLTIISLKFSSIRQTPPLLTPITFCYLFFFFNFEKDSVFLHEEWIHLREFLFLSNHQASINR